MRGNSRIRPGALPIFGPGAMRGSLAPSAEGPRPARAPNNRHVADPTQIPPVRQSQFGAPSGQRLGVIEGLLEWAHLRTRFTGQFFVADPAIYTRVVKRRMGAPPIVRGLIPSRDQAYRAPQYVGVPGVQPPPPAPSTPTRRLMRRGIGGSIR